MLYHFISKISLLNLPHFIFKAENRPFTVLLLLKNYKICLTIPVREFIYVRINPSTDVISVALLYYIYNMSYYYKNLNLMFASVRKPTFLLLYYIGKGYKFYKDSRNTLTFQMGFSHLVYLYNTRATSVLKLKRYIFLFGFTLGALKRVGKDIVSSKFANIFTQRGV